MQTNCASREGKQKETSSKGYLRKVLRYTRLTKPCLFSSCELCFRVHTTHSVGHSFRSEYQHLPYDPLKPCKPLIYISIIIPS